MSKYDISQIFLCRKQQLESITPIKSEDGRLKTVLTVAGSDSSGGAGIEADLKTITVHRCYGLTGITTLTAQNTTGVFDAVSTPEDIMMKILDSNFADIPIDSIKTGLLTTASVTALRQTIDKYKYEGSLVVDPVMVSTSGFEFFKDELLESIVKNLSKNISLLTPNLIEAKKIVNILSNEKKYDEANLTTLEEFFEMCLSIHKLSGISNILIKGGHQKWKDAKLLTDVLYCSAENKFYVFNSEMIDSKNTHGTGCTLSSAIASNLAHGLSLINSIANGIVYVQNGIKSSPQLGNGNGPLNHIQHVKQFNYEATIKTGFVLPFEKGDALKYLISRPEIAPLWKYYTNHPFMRQMRDKTLPLEKFIDFCEQDIVYLINYAHIFSFLTTITVNQKECQAIYAKIDAINKETEKYRIIFAKFGGIHDDITANKACKKYMEDLLDLSRHRGDFFDVSLSLAPCFHGYYTSCKNAEAQLANGTLDDKTAHDSYELWFEENISDELGDALKNSEKSLNELFEQYCTSEVKLERAVEIFKKFTILDIEFLDVYTS